MLEAPRLSYCRGAADKECIEVAESTRTAVGAVQKEPTGDECMPRETTDAGGWIKGGGGGGRGRSGRGGTPGRCVCSIGGDPGPAGAGGGGAKGAAAVLELGTPPLEPGVALPSGCCGRFACSSFCTCSYVSA